MTVADRIAVMDRGHIVQVGVPAEIYEQPSSRYVAQFVGDVNLIEGRLVAGGPGGAAIDSSVGRLTVRQAVDAALGATVWLALRPEKVQVRAEPPVGAGHVTVTGIVTEIGYLGKMSIYKVRLDDGSIVEAAIANATRTVERPIAWNDRVWLSFAADAGVVLTR